MYCTEIAINTVIAGKSTEQCVILTNVSSISYTTAKFSIVYNVLVCQTEHVPQHLYCGMQNKTLNMVEGNYLIVDPSQSSVSNAINNFQVTFLNLELTQ